MAAVVPNLRDIIKRQQEKKKVYLRPLFVQCAQLLDSKLLAEDVSLQLQEGIKNLPEEVKEQLFSQMSAQQLGRHYEVLLGKFVTSLYVNKWPILDTSHFFLCLAKECPFLENIHLNSMVFQSSSVPSLRQLLQTVSLKSFSFTNSPKGITRESFECIMQHTPALTNLNIACLDLTDDNLKMLPHHPSLTQLQLVECFRFTGASLAHIKACTGLRHLALRVNRNWTNDELISFCSRDSGCTQLESLELDHIKQFTSVRIHLPNLTSLKMDSIWELDAFELGCPELRELLLKILVTNGEMIAKEIPNLKKLVSFSLREDQFVNVDFSEIMRHIGRHTDLNSFKLPCSNGYISPQVLNSFTSPLEKLLIMNITEITDETIAAFSKHLPNLKELDVSGSSLVRPIFDFPNLTVLDSNKISTLQTIHVKCPNMEILDFSNCPNLESVVWECPTVHTIYMAGLEKFTNEELCKMTAACQNLNKVMMSKIPNISDDVAVALATLPKLQILNVSDCPQITEKTLEQLYNIFPHISFYQ